MNTTKAIFAAILVGLLSAAAQQPAPQPRPQQQANAPLQKTTYKFESTTQLVIVNVSAKDKNGNPIEGLKASDFTVTEDGKPQVVKVFEYQRLEDDAQPLPPPPPPSLQPRAQPAAALPPVVPPVVNQIIAPARQGEIKYRDRRLLVLYFDFQGMPPDDQIRAQAGAMKFVKTQMTPSDMVAVMEYGGELKLLSDFTNDRDALLKTVNRLVIGEASDMGNVTADDTAEDNYAAFTADDSEFNIFNTDRQLSALENAVKQLSSLAEKKAMVYISSGVQRSGTDNDAQLRATINAAIRSNVSFYTLDARGLVANAPAGNASRGSGGNSGGRGNAGNYSGGSMRSQAGNLQGSQDTLYALAVDTGGKEFVDQNDLSLGIVQAQKAIASYYILGYYSGNTALDGHYRRIKVQIGRDLSAKLDYRTGYFASKEFKQFNSSDRERQLQEALTLGDPITDLSLALETDYFRTMRDLYRVPVAIKIPGSDIELAKRGGAQSTRIDFLAEVRDEKNRVAGVVRDNIIVKLNEETAAQLSKRTVAYDTVFALPPGTYTIKFLARENETGKMGTFQTKFRIPDLTAEQKYLPISSVVLSNQREEQKALVGAAFGDRRMFNFNPLVQGGQKLIPSVTRVFRRDQDLYVFLEAYQPAAETTQPMIASLAFYRGKVKAFESEPVQVSDGLNPMTKAVPVRFSVPLAKLEPGMYTCQVSVLDPAAQKFAFWRAPMVLLGQ
ncbi:MAG: VWA domain-containing protein [Acidobacteriia bacterium]|nr:VWA domain-containing protein [Terriglobia bacterium]